MAVKLLLVELDLSHFEVLVPSLEDVPQTLDSVGTCFVGQDGFRVLLEVSVALESLEASHLANLHSSNSLTLSRPESHDLRSEAVLVALFGFLSQCLLQILYFTLFGAQKGIAPSPLSITSLLLLVVESSLGSDVLLHGLSPEVDDKLVQSGRETLVFECFLHLVNSLELLLWHNFSSNRRASLHLIIILSGFRVDFGLFSSPVGMKLRVNGCNGLR